MSNALVVIVLIALTAIVAIFVQIAKLAIHNVTQIISNSLIDINVIFKISR